MGALLVGLGSALGGMTRYSVGLLAARLSTTAFPYATLSVNLIGSFIIAIVAGYLGMRPDALSSRGTEFLLIGFCGGLTTYSSFNEQTLALLRAGDLKLATLNVVGTLVACGLAGVLGFSAGRMAGAS